MKNNKIFNNELTSFTILIIGIIIIGIMVLLALRIGRGLFGIVLAVLTAGLMLYWIRELQHSFAREVVLKTPPSKKWNYDLLEDDDNITLVAEVPGSSEDIKVTINDNILEIVGRDDFRKELKLSSKVEIYNMSFLNGILNVKFRKLRTASKNS